MKKLRRAKRLQKQAAQKSQIPAQAIERRRRPWLPLRTLLVAQLLFAAPVFAAPQGGQVTSGSATINQEGTVTNIDQNSGKAIINWQRFGIAPNETVNFNQPNSHAVALNRVVGHESSLIEGALNANGQVFLINSAGVTIANGASINTAGFVASTQDISDADFLNGDYTFSGDSDAAVINLGTITATDGGYVILLGKTVSNQGVITATKGTVALAGGAQTTLNFNGDSIVSVTVDQGTLDALVENKEAIYADGGNVILTAKAADDLLSAQVNNSGIIQARTIDDLTGAIKLYAHGGTTTVDGTLDASAPNGGDGGFIETSGDTVTVADSAVITTLAADGETGTWLIDPDGFVISNNGGDISATLLGTLLDSNHITLESTQGNGDNGDIDVNDAVSWSANTTLTLTATNDININAAISAGGEDAGLELNYGSDYNIADGGRITFSHAGNLDGLTINGAVYALIHSMDALAAVDGTGRYAIAEDLDAASWSTDNAGTDSVIVSLDGSLTGLGHSISNLTLIRSGYQRIGLIGTAAAGSVIRDLNLVDANVAGYRYVGPLAGYSSATIKNVSASGTVTGTTNSSGGDASRYLGGLIGYQNNGSISDAQADVDVTSGSATDAEGRDADDSRYAGGLIGYAKNTSISASAATGDVSGSDGIGGLIGYTIGVDGSPTTVTDCSASGTVTGTDWYDGTLQASQWVGGLIGRSYYTTINTSHATGNVTGSTHLGGLLGNSRGYTAVNNSFATGTVYSAYAPQDSIIGFIGGLIGSSKEDISIIGSYATGDVYGVYYVGGMIGAVNYDVPGVSSPTEISGCHAAGNVSTNEQADSSHNIGGLIGYAKYATVSDSYATGNVDASEPGVSAGGLIGTADYSTVHDSYASGDVFGATSVGGLIGGGGYLDLDNVSASGNVYGNASYIGGLGGSITQSTITNATATGNVYAISSRYGGNGELIDVTYVGGLLGTSAANTITGVSASGNVTVEGSDGSGSYGALIGETGGDTIDGATATGSVTVEGENSGRLSGSTNDRYGDSSFTNSTYTDVAAEAARQEREDIALNAMTTAASSEEQNEYTVDDVDNWTEEVSSGQVASSTAEMIEENISYANSFSYSSSIKSIEIDGVRYNMEEDDDSDASSDRGQKN